VAARNGLGGRYIGVRLRSMRHGLVFERQPVGARKHRASIASRCCRVVSAEFEAGGERGVGGEGSGERVTGFTGACV